MRHVIGIDLGTTFSAVARIGDSGRPEIVRNREGESITPSVVLFQDDQPLVGTQAKRQAAMTPDDVVQFVKRHMGDPDWRFGSTTGQEYTAEQVSAIILKRLKEDAEIALGQPCPDAVITVPAYFDDPRRRATIDAGTIAGFNVLRVLNEPTAAALAYGMDKSDAGTCLVYDLGGGTFDVTVLHIAGGVLDVKSTTGDRNLGGFDFDNAMMRLVNDQVQGDGGPDLFDGETLEAGLRERCETAKRTLSTTEQAKVFLSANGRNFRIQVTREQFETATEDLLRRTRDMMDEALDDAGLSYPDIDRVLLVGGSTRMPMVARMVLETTGRTPELTVNPDEAVALGAAIQARLTTAETHGLGAGSALEGITAVLDVTSQSLGVVALERKMGRYVEYNSIIIPHNSKIPAQYKERYQTIEDNQTEIKAQVTQGDDREVSYVQVIAETTITIPPYPAGAPVEVTMSYDIDNVIQVEVVDLTTNTRLNEFEIDYLNNRKPDEVREMRAALVRVEVQ